MIARATQWSLIGIGSVLIICSSNINWGKQHWHTVLQADAKGYYAYLPALLIEHDPNFGSFDARENGPDHNPDLYYDYRTAHNGRTINKYFCGTAIAQLPFFLAAHAYSFITDSPVDGYEKPYVVATNLAAICWTLIGLWALATLLATYGIDDKWIALTLILFTFGTNLFYYAVVAPGMAHAYAFGMCTLFLLSLRRAACSTEEPMDPVGMSGTSGLVGERRMVNSEWRPGLTLLSRTFMFHAGILLGLIFLVRPVNVLIVLAVPILFPSGAQFKEWLKKMITRPAPLIGALVMFVLVTSLQFLYYRIATGAWFVYSYGEEGFNWFDPHFFDILFSYKKGLFVYMPILLLALVGLRYMRVRSTWMAASWIAFALLLTYVLSSWWNWWYGGSFGARPYVEYFALFALPFALALQDMAPKFKRIYLSIAFLLVVLCQIQTYQARYYRIHWETMTKEKYWDVFLRVDRLGG